MRVILDSSLKIPLGSKVLLGDGRKIIFHSEDISSEKVDRLGERGVELYAVPGEGDLLDLHEVLRKLGELNIASVMVEGGRKVFSSFLREELADKLLYFIAPRIVGGGIGPFDEIEICSIGESIELKNVRIRRMSHDLLIEGYF